MKSKLLILLALLLILILLLTACGGAANNAADENMADNDMAEENSVDNDMAEEPANMNNAAENAAGGMDEPVEVIYGLDERYEACESCSGAYADAELNQLGASVAVLVRPAAIYDTGTSLLWNAYSLEERLEITYDIAMCTEERFAAQPAPGFCTGFLLDPQHLVTARHCVPTPESCAETEVVFDFVMDEEGNAAALETESVFSCAGVYYATEGNRDIVVLTLDRDTGRPGLPLAETTQTLDTNLVVIGHPSGLPRKLAIDASVLKNDPLDDYFVTDLDSFSGNSGSPVIDQTTYQVVGMLIGGEVDYEKTENGCLQVKVCDPNDGTCSGEAVLRVEAFLSGQDVEP